MVVIPQLVFSVLYSAFGIQHLVFMFSMPYAVSSAAMYCVVRMHYVVSIMQCAACMTTCGAHIVCYSLILHHLLLIMVCALRAMFVQCVMYLCGVFILFVVTAYC